MFFRAIGATLCNHTNGGEGVPGIKRSEETRAKISKNNARGRSRQVIQFDLDWSLVNEFNSTVEASKATGVEQGYIARVCRGVYATSGGYRWKYKNKAS